MTASRAAMIRGYLKHAGTSQSDIAKQAGVTRGLVCHVIAGRRRNRDVRRAVAEAIHLEPHNLWGD